MSNYQVGDLIPIQDQSLRTKVVEEIDPSIRYAPTTDDGANNYSIDTSGEFQLIDGQTIYVDFTTMNTGASTITVDTQVDPIDIVRSIDPIVSVQQNDLTGRFHLVYNATNDVLIAYPKFTIADRMDTFVLKNAEEYIHPATHDVSMITNALSATEIDARIAAVVDASPATLDTLNELAAALGDDPNFATTVTNQIATKLDASAYTASDVLAKLASAGSNILFNDKAILNGGLEVNSGAGFRLKRGSTQGDGDDVFDMTVTDTTIQFKLDNDNDSDSSQYQFGHMSGGVYTETLAFNNTNITYKGSTIWHAGNDGSGSGLDADTIDGVHASALVNAAGDTMTGELTIAKNTAAITNSAYNDGHIELQTSDGSYPRMGFHRGGYTALALYHQGLGKDEILRIRTSGGWDGSILHEGWMGSGNGLDADKLDGLHASSFWKTNAKNTFSIADTNANATFYANNIDYNVSGATTLTADRTHAALRIDVDSSATGGDTSNEHRVYGIYSDVTVTGDSDLVYSQYNYVRSLHTSGTITNLYAQSNYANGDNTGGHVSNVIGSYNTAQWDGVGGTVSNVRGMWGRAYLTPNPTTVPSVMVGVRGEVELNNTLSPTTGYAVEAIIDRNGAGGLATAVLFYGNYEGTPPSNSYGIKIDDAVQNYLGGSLNVKGALTENNQSVAKFEIIDTTFPAGATSHVVNNSFIVESTCKVDVVPQADTAGVWEVTYVNGSVTITSSASEPSAIAVKIFVTKK